MVAPSTKSQSAIFTDEEILTYFIDYFFENGTWPMYKQLLACPTAPSPEKVPRRFTSLALTRHAASLRAGLLPKFVMVAVTCKRPVLLGQIQQHPCYNPLWRVKRTQAVRDPDFPKLSDIIFAFGTLDNFLRTAGLLPTQPSLDDLLAAIRLATATLGHTPTVNDCDGGFCGYPRKTYLEYYPSWNTLLSAAGLEINEKHADKQKPETRQKVAIFYQTHFDKCNSDRI